MGGSRASLAAALVGFAASFPITPGAEAQNVGDEDYAQMWFVPRLRGAVSMEGGVGQPIHLNTDAGYPSTWFAGLGYKHYFEEHGRLQLRIHATYERGSLLNPSVEGTANRFGLVGALTARGITDQWFFGQISLLVDASLLNHRPAPRPFDGGQEQRLTGTQFGGGVETTFGSMFMLAPYLMAETGASVTISRVELGSVESWEFWARWVVRFDAAIRRDAAQSKPTVSSP